MWGTTKIRNPFKRRSAALLVVSGTVALAVFIALTVAVTTSSSLGFDSAALEAAEDLRVPWLDSVARALTTLGLIAVVGPALLLGAALLTHRRRRPEGIVLIAGGGLTWLAVWVTKTLVSRPRPPAPLVHTAGQSFPSAHAANSLGWLALALALAVIIPTRAGRTGAGIAGFLIAGVVGLSRVYLRAHYLSDVVAGEALAVAIFSFAALGVFILSPARDARSTSLPDREGAPAGEWPRLDAN